MEFDVVTIGNAILDAFLTIQDANTHCRVNREEKELCIKAGEKILLESCVFCLGGGACNVGVGLARLNNKTGVIAELGDDEFAVKILKTLERENIDTSLLRRVHKQSSFTIGLNFQGERTLFTNQTPGPHDFNLHMSTRMVYLAALGNEWKGAYEKAVLYKKEKGCLLAFNPGPLQIQEGLEGIKNVIAVCDFLFLNLSESQELLGDTSTDREFFIKRFQELGAQTVIITDGENGSSARDDKQLYSCDIVAAPVVEKTGAGDAYATGVVGAILQGKTMEEAMKWGALNAASVVGQIGAQAGLLTKEELEKKV